LACGVIDLEGATNLFQVRKSLSCNRDLSTKANLISILSADSYLSCQPNLADSFEPINAFEARRRYKHSNNFPSCNYSLWFQNGTVLKAFESVSSKCKVDKLRDKPFENCEIFNLLYARDSFTAVTSVPDVDINLGNLLTIERQSRREPRRKNKSLIHRIQDGQSLTMKLRMNLLSYTGSELKCRTRLNGITLLIYRWHPDSFVHLLESLFRLFKTMKSHDMLNVSTRIVNLDPLEGKESKYMGHKLKRNGITTTGHYKYGEILRAFSTSIYHLDMFRETPICFEHAIIVGFASHSLGAFSGNRSDLNEFRDFLMKKLNSKMQTENEYGQITLLSRSNLIGYGDKSLAKANRRRHILNEEEIAFYLQEKLGVRVQVARMNEFDIQDQILIMLRSRIVISVHSAALINILWMKAGSGVVQLHVDGTHLGSGNTLQRNPLLTNKCGIPLHMMLHVETLASSLGLRYAEVRAGGLDSIKNKAIESCEKTREVSYTCCSIFDKEDHLHRFAEDFHVNKHEILQAVTSLIF